MKPSYGTARCIDRKIVPRANNNWLFRVGIPIMCACSSVASEGHGEDGPLSCNMEIICTTQSSRSGLFVGRLVCWTVLSTRHGMCISPFGRWCGPPTASPLYRAPVYRGCPCRDPLGCPPMPRQDGIGSRAPTFCGCAVLVVVDL